MTGRGVSTNVHFLRFQARKRSFNKRSVPAISGQEEESRQTFTSCDFRPGRGVSTNVHFLQYVVREHQSPLTPCK